MINLIYQHYTSGNPDRDREFEICREKNDEAGLTLWPIHGQKRVTFREMFLYVNHVSEPGDIVIIANSDIYFLPEIKSQIESLNLKGICLALSRWDLMPDGSLKPYHKSDSQDAFIFSFPIKEQCCNINYSPGTPGCDNRLCYDLTHLLKYKVYNPCKDIKAIHVHNTGLRTYTATSERVPPPYLQVHPTHLKQHFK